jgi:tetratricopeptide (TPR) repeat protein
MDLAAAIPAWLEASRDAEIPTGLPVGEALGKAVLLRETIRQGEARPRDFVLSAESVEVLHALCLLFDRDEMTAPERLLEDCGAAFHFVETVAWPEDGFGGPAEVLSRLAFLCWRNARQAGNASKEWSWMRAHDRATSANRGTTELFLSTMASDLSTEVEGNLLTRNAELPLSICEHLRSQLETNPRLTYERAAFLAGNLVEHGRSADPDLKWFHGELALIAGTTRRITSRRLEASRWFEKAEAVFASLPTRRFHLARVTYQRLALQLETRDFEKVGELAGRCAEDFADLGVPEESVKCGFLQAAALREVGQIGGAIGVLERVCGEAESLGATNLLAHGLNDLAQFFRVAGNPKVALEYAQRALPMLVQLDNRMALAKLRWCVGDILRDLGRTFEALQTYQEAAAASEQIELRGDVAAIRLAMAELLLDSNELMAAEEEIRSALQVIEEERMLPEGIAALALLKESVRRRRKIDRRALRSLNQYLERSKS